MRLVFFGGGEFAATVLEKLAQVHEVALVVTPPPAPAGRKMALTAPPAAQRAQQLKLPLAHGISPDQLRQQQAAATIVCDYGKILPPELLDAAGGAVNIHPSLLPRWRGATPMERAVLAGDTETGVTIMQMSEELDQGDILAQWAMPLADDHTAAALAPLLAEQGAALLLQVLAAPQDYPPQPQDDAQATYANKILPEELRLDFNDSAVQCRRRVLAFSPQPGAYCLHNEERLRVLAAETTENNANAKPGTLLAADDKQGIVIACGEGALKVTHLQRAGKRAMPVADFLRGFSLRDAIGKPL